MIQNVYERCQEARCFAEVMVATDDDRIRVVVERFGGRAVMTSPDCASGTDRVAEVARVLGGDAADVVINVQGDEPAVHPQALATLAAAFDDRRVEMATLVRPLEEAERPNPNVVKAVLDELGYALYFSRQDIPFARAEVPLQRWAHIGMYGFRRATLLKVSSLPPTALERTESLEQLRALGHGVRILCGKTQHTSVAVDRPEDVAPAEAAVKQLLASRSAGADPFIPR